MRCLADAAVAVEVEAREVDQPVTDDEELRSPYVHEGVLDLIGAWAHDALALAVPQQLLCRPDCAGLCPVCGESLNDAAAGRARPPARAGPALGEAARASQVATIPRRHGRPEEENLLAAARQAPRHAQGRQAAPQRVPALPQPATAASRLPGLRHLRRAAR